MEPVEVTETDIVRVVYNIGDGAAQTFDQIKSRETQENAPIPTRKNKVTVAQFVNDPNTGEISWSQKTYGGSRSLLSGIYFWRVTSLMPESEGKTQSGTFVVIK